MNSELIIIALCISFATLGFRAITGEGMILYFLRQPFDNLVDRKELIIEAIEHLKEQATEEYNNRESSKEGRFSYEYHDRSLKKIESTISQYEEDNPNKYNWLIYIAKPFITCSTCMASVHTVVWYLIFNYSFDHKMILVMLMVALINTFIWTLIQVVQNLGE